VQALQWGFRYTEFTQKAHARYGPTFTARIGGLPPMVVTIDREAIRRLFTGDPLVRRHANDQLRPLFGDGSVAMREPAEHLERRRMLLPAFHGESVRAYAELTENLWQRELERWPTDKPLAVLPCAQQVTLDVILYALLGDHESAVRGRVRGIFDAMEAIPGSAIGGYFPRLGKRRRWNLPAERYWRLRDEFDTTLTEQIVAARKGGAEEGSILELLLHENDSDEEMRDELKTLIAAGHATTAAAIAWGVELLAHNPEVLMRLRTALEEGAGEYADAVAKEVLRMWPTIPLAATRHLLVPFEIGGYTIEPETVIAVNAYGLHRDPTLYPEPERMQPERFLGKGPDPYSFLPFGGGAHRCLGDSLALLEIRIALSEIVRRFDLVAEDATPARPERRGTTLVPRGGARVRVHAR
jgi:cytochrome P450